MVDPIFLRAGTSVATTAIRLGWPTIKSTLARRNVAAGEPVEYDRAGAYLDGVLDMLAGRAETGAGQVRVVVEQFLSNVSSEITLPYAQQWLLDPEARAHLKSAVLGAFNGKDTSENERLAGERLEALGMDVRKEAKPLVEDVLDPIWLERWLR